MRAKPRDLLLQHRARAVRQVRGVVMIEHVAQHERRRRQPGNAPERRQVRLHREIAVALLPIGDRVARHRLHVDVVGEEIVAAVGLLIGAVEEILDVETLADQTSLHVGHAGDDGVDLAAIGGNAQLFQCQSAGHARRLGFEVIATRPARKRAARVSVIGLKSRPGLVAIGRAGLHHRRRCTSSGSRRPWRSVGWSWRSRPRSLGAASSTVFQSSSGIVVSSSLPPVVR